MFLGHNDGMLPIENVILPGIAAQPARAPAA